MSEPPSPPSPPSPAPKDSWIPDGFVDRDEFLEVVGIHDRTLSRWVQEGYLTPEYVKRNRYWRQIFGRGDITFARGLRTSLTSTRGGSDSRKPYQIVRGDAAFPEGPHDPGDPKPLDHLT